MHLGSPISVPPQPQSRLQRGIAAHKHRTKKRARDKGVTVGFHLLDSNAMTDLDLWSNVGMGRYRAVDAERKAGSGSAPVGKISSLIWFFLMLFPLSEPIFL